MRHVVAVAQRGAGRRWSQDEGRAIVEAWRRSGISVAAFAQRRGVQGQRLQYWIDRVAAPHRGREATVQFHPVRLVKARAVEDRASTERLEVVLADGRAVRVPTGFAAEDLQRLLRVLEVLR